MLRESQTLSALVEGRDYLPPYEKKTCFPNILAGGHSISPQLGDHILTLAQGVVSLAETVKNAFGKGGMNGSNDTHLPREVMKAVPAQFGVSGVSSDICAQLGPVGPMWDPT